MASDRRTRPSLEAASRKWPSQSPLSTYLEESSLLFEGGLACLDLRQGQLVTSSRAKVLPVIHATMAGFC